MSLSNIVQPVIVDEVKFLGSFAPNSDLNMDDTDFHNVPLDYTGYWSSPDLSSFITINVSTGIITVVKPGKYLINATSLTRTSANTMVYVKVNKNGNTFSTVRSTLASSNESVSINAVIAAENGDELSVSGRVAAGTTHIQFGKGDIYRNSFIDITYLGK